MDEDFDFEKKNRPALKKFKKETRYPHNRSEGMTRRKNKGSQFVIESDWTGTEDYNSMIKKGLDDD